eukprot:scaffold1154_cov310-Pinguiococcus_pyrenoidosus.AAC.32
MDLLHHTFRKPLQGREAGEVAKKLVRAWGHDPFHSGAELPANHDASHFGSEVTERRVLRAGPEILALKVGIHRVDELGQLRHQAFPLGGKG